MNFKLVHWLETLENTSFDSRLGSPPCDKRLQKEAEGMYPTGIA